MDFFDTLVRYETALWNRLDDALHRSGAASLATVTALRAVRRHDGTCRVQDLRAELGITVGAASKLVDRLERDGLALRRPHPTDRRSSLVALTESGISALATGTELLGRELDDHLRDEPDLAAATQTLRRLDARLRIVEPVR